MCVARSSALADALKDLPPDVQRSSDKVRLWSGRIKTHVAVGERLGLFRILGRKLVSEKAATVIARGPVGMADDVRDSISGLGSDGESCGGELYVASPNHFEERRQQENRSYSPLKVVPTVFPLNIRVKRDGRFQLVDVRCPPGPLINLNLLRHGVNHKSSPWTKLEFKITPTASLSFPERNQEKSASRSVNEVDPTSWCRPTRRPADSVRVGEQGACG